MDSREQILGRDWSTDFVAQMQNRIVVSHYKYGWMAESYPTGLANAIKSLKARINLYEQTGNTEWLIDVANFAMIEYMYPVHPCAHFRATGSSESPGLCGISAKELLENETPA